jgi:hypothetical protein
MITGGQMFSPTLALGAGGGRKLVGELQPNAPITLLPEPTISVACTKCRWQAEFSGAELMARFGLEYPLPNLLEHLAAPDCSRRGNQWDRCGAYYVNPIGCSS